MHFLQLEVFGFVLESVALNLVLERTRLNYAKVLIVPKSRIQVATYVDDYVHSSVLQ